MSEKLFKFYLSELNIIRIRCMNTGCGLVSEVPLADLDRFFRSGECPHCRGPVKDGDKNRLVELAQAVRGLKAIEKTVQVEFVIPEAKGP